MGEPKTQGDALGWYIRPRWGWKRKGEILLEKHLSAAQSLHTSETNYRCRVSAEAIFSFL